MRAAGFIAAVMVLAGLARAQREPHIGYAFPAGGQRGTTFELAVGGQAIDEASGLLVSGGGIEAQVVRHYRIMTAQQLNGVKNNLEKLRELEFMMKTNAALKPRVDAVRADIERTFRAIGIDGGIDMKAYEAYRKKAADPKRQLNPALSELLKLRVTIAAGAKPGDRELRVVTAKGLSNPIRFQVGALEEVNEQEPNQERGAAQAVAKTPVVLNGQVLPGDVDRFRFPAKAGEKLVAAAAARALIPYLADAVPGWFQATLALYDTNGTEVAFDDDFRSGPDPVIACTIPRDGDYVLEIRDSIYRGREDFVYRITLGEVPFVAGAFPMGGKPGSRLKVELDGWNLADAKAKVDLPPGAAGICPIAIPAGEGVAMVPFAVDDLPEASDGAHNDTRDDAQKIALPVAVNGRIDRPGDVDWFRFNGRSGEVVVAEVFARRLDSPLDARLMLVDAKGGLVAAADDNDDKAAGLETHHADPRLQATLPATGAYYLQLVDAQKKGGAAFAYRCRIGPTRPDFELRAVPASVNVRPGLSTPVTIYAVRRDGFDGDIAIALKNAPEGFEVGGGVIPAGQEKVRITLTAPLAPTGAPVAVSFEGIAKVDGREVRRPVVPAEDMMQAFFYRHLVPAQSAFAFVSGRPRQAAPPRVLSDLPIRVPTGGVAVVRIAGPSPAKLDKLDLVLSDPPDGLSISKVNVLKNGAELVLAADAAKLKPGLKGNLIVEAHVERESKSKEGKMVKSRLPVGLLPAIPFEIVAAPGP